MTHYLRNKEFDLVVNIPLRDGGARRVSSFGYPSRGYLTRRMAIDYSVPLVTNVKVTNVIFAQIAAKGYLGACN